MKPAIHSMISEMNSDSVAFPRYSSLIHQTNHSSSSNHTHHQIKDGVMSMSQSEPMELSESGSPVNLDSTQPHVSQHHHQQQPFLESHSGSPSGGFLSHTQHINKEATIETNSNSLKRKRDTKECQRTSSSGGQTKWLYVSPSTNEVINSNRKITDDGWNYVDEV